MKRSGFKQKLTVPMKIRLSKNKFALIDNEDFDKIKHFTWWFDGKKYAVSKDKNGKAIKMHRIILGTPKDKLTDHINNNPLDNRKFNLRICTDSENKYNIGLKSNNTSGLKGVDWVKHYKKWRARITVNKKTIHIGMYSDKIEAGKAYNKFALKLHREFAVLNII